MALGTDRPFDRSPESLTRFRHRVVGLVQALIVARAIHEPRFLTEKLRKQWHPNDKLFKKRGEYLLAWGKRQFEQVLREFVGYDDSIPSPESQEDLDLEELRENVASLLLPQDLDKAIKRLQEKKKVGWAALVRWDLLSGIREGFDRIEPRAALPLRRWPKTLRNLYFLCWYEDQNSDTLHSPARIRDLWNEKYPQQKIGKADKSNGREAVKKGIKSAQEYLKKAGVSVQTAIAQLENQSS